MDPKTNRMIRRAIRLDRAAPARDDPWPEFDLELLTQARKHSLLLAGLRRPKPRGRLLSRKKEGAGATFVRPAEVPSDGEGGPTTKGTPGDGAPSP